MVPEGKWKKGEGLREALFREANEELGIQLNEVLGVRKVGTETTTTHGGSGHYYLMEVPFSTLARVAHKINQKPNPFREARKARIIRFKTIGKNPKLVQPHYKQMLPKIKQLLSRPAQRK